MISSAKAQTNGVLPVTASPTAGNAQKPIAGKPSNPKLKVIVRRLPPGLTEAEFLSIIGDDWRLGSGKVDWFLYKRGKDSKDPSKPSRPARAYLHLTNETHTLTLDTVIRQAIFEDALNTSSNSCLVGPPNVEFAPFGRVPGGRRRVDVRAGTIDQDAEFMAFLEGLANPISSKEVSSESTNKEGGKVERVTTTPLVQYLKDKKANRKEAVSKSTKKQDAATPKGKASKDAVSSTEDVKRKGRDSRVERAAKEAVRILNREATSKSSTGTSVAAKSAAGLADSSPPKLDLGKVSGRQRGPAIAAHIRMLQRDLGLTPAQAHRQVRRDTADAQKAEKASASEKPDTARLAATPTTSGAAIPTAPKSSIPAQPSARGARNRGSSAKIESTSQTAGSSAPIVLLKKSESTSVTPTTQPTKPVPAVNHRKAPVTVPSDGATQAFVKHANPSQGVTEALLKDALERFGPVSFVEIDKRKGFAYVDFVDTSGLKKAMAANPIPVAQGTVHVAQRKGAAPAPASTPSSTADKKPTPQTPSAPTNRGGRGGQSRGGNGSRRGGRGGRGASNTQAGSTPSIQTGSGNSK